MPIPTALLDALPLLACPRCGGGLAPIAPLECAGAPGRDALECLDCRARWPLVSGVLDCLAEPVEPVPSADLARTADAPEEPRDR
jgi:hypothetical protein